MKRKPFWGVEKWYPNFTRPLTLLDVQTSLINIEYDLTSITLSSGRGGGVVRPMFNSTLASELTLPNKPSRCPLWRGTAEPTYLRRSPPSSCPDLTRVECLIVVRSPADTVPARGRVSKNEIRDKISKISQKTDTVLRIAQNIYKYVKTYINIYI